MQTSIKIISESGRDALALIKFKPDSTEDSLLLKRAIELNYEEGDQDKIYHFLVSAAASLNRGFKPLEGVEINTSFETIVRIARV